MSSKFLKHSWYHISLVGILFFGFLFTIFSSSNRSLQIGIIVLTAFLYILWGIIHHLVSHDLNMKIVLEYVLIGTFGLVLILFLFLI